MKKILFQLSLAAIFVLAALGSAVAQSGFVAQTWVYDPGHTGVSVSQWQPGSGLPDAGNSNHGLYLTKFASTTTLAAAGASIKGVNGIKLSTLGFDVRNDGWCGAGAPRYNVTLVGGDSFYFFLAVPTGFTRRSSVIRTGPGFASPMRTPSRLTEARGPALETLK